MLFSKIYTIIFFKQEALHYFLLNVNSSFQRGTQRYLREGLKEQMRALCKTNDFK